MVIIGVYGTLRDGWTNHYTYNVNSGVHIGVGTTNELALYVKGLPFAIVQKGKLVLDVYDVANIDYHNIALMELSAGYTEVDHVIKMNNGKKVTAKVFTYPMKIGKLIKSGDFNERQ